MRQPKGCMAKKYAMEMFMGFLIKYIQDFRIMTRRVWDAKGKKGASGEVLEGVSFQINLDPT